VGTVKLRVPRDRAGRFSSNIIPANRRYDEATEKDVALLNLAGLSTRMLAQMSDRLLGIRVSATEVSNALHTIVPAAKAFLSRPLGDRKWIYLYVDGTNFRVRRSTVGIEPTLVVLGVDETGRKSVLSMVQGDKDSRTAWDAVFVDLKERGLDGSCVLAGIMDGLPGLGDSFREAFTGAKVLRCWVHKARNVMPLVPRRYQAALPGRVERYRVCRQPRGRARRLHQAEGGVEQGRGRCRRTPGARHRGAARPLRVPSGALGRAAHDQPDRAREQGVQATLEGDGGRQPQRPQAPPRLHRDPSRVRVGADPHHLEQAARTQVARAPRAPAR